MERSFSSRGSGDLSMMDTMAPATVHPGEHGIVTVVLCGASGWTELIRRGLGWSNRGGGSAARASSPAAMWCSAGSGTAWEKDWEGRGGGAVLSGGRGALLIAPREVAAIDGMARCRSRCGGAVDGASRNRWHRRRTRHRRKRVDELGGSWVADERGPGGAVLDGASGRVGGACGILLRRRVVAERFRERRGTRWAWIEAWGS